VKGRHCWGSAKQPVKTPVEPLPKGDGGDWIHRLGPSPDRATLRSITPPGFAKAFFEANP